MTLKRLLQINLKNSTAYSSHLQRPDFGANRNGPYLEQSSSSNQKLPFDEWGIRKISPFHFFSLAAPVSVALLGFGVGMVKKALKELFCLFLNSDLSILGVGHWR